MTHDYVAPQIDEDVANCFQALISGEYANFCLMSILHDGQPSHAICAVNQVIGSEDVCITPLFVCVKPDMLLVDPFGQQLSDIPVA